MYWTSLRGGTHREAVGNCVSTLKNPGGIVYGVGEAFSIVTKQAVMRGLGSPASSPAHRPLPARNG